MLVLGRVYIISIYKYIDTTNYTSIKVEAEVTLVKASLVKGIVRNG